MIGALAVVAFLPGLAIGSFLNVVVHRVPRREAIGASRSACPACGEQIRARDNIPLISFLLLRGRCRDCRSPIPLRYPVVEATTAALALVCIARFGATPEGVLIAVFGAVVVVLAAIDLEHRIVPNRIVLPAAAAALAARTVLDPGVEWIASALGASGFLLAAALACPKGMGMGDVKLALLLGAVLGPTVAVALLVAMIAALAPAAVALARGGSARGLTVPFVPFLALGSVVALFAGEPILAWYLEGMGW